MSESVPENTAKRASQQVAGEVKAAGEPVVVPVSDNGSDAQGGGTREIGGPEGPEPTRFGDWERKGRCIDF